MRARRGLETERRRVGGVGNAAPLQHLGRGLGLRVAGNLRGDDAGRAAGLHRLAPDRTDRAVGQHDGSGHVLAVEIAPRACPRRRRRACATRPPGAVENELMASGTRSCPRDSTTSPSAESSRRTASRISQPWLVGWNGVVARAMPAAASLRLNPLERSVEVRVARQPPERRHARHQVHRRLRVGARRDGLVDGSALRGSERSSGGRCGGADWATSVGHASRTRTMAKRIQTDDMRAGLDSPSRHPLGLLQSLRGRCRATRPPPARRRRPVTLASGFTSTRATRLASLGLKQALWSPFARVSDHEAGAANGPASAGSRDSDRETMLRRAGWPALLHQALCARRRKGRSVMGLGEPRAC